MIRSAIDGKCYIGSASRSFSERWSHHRKSLDNGTHRNRYLQRAWDKHGGDVFEFRVIRYTEPHEALEYEQAMIDFYKAADPKHGYNLSPTAGSPRGVKHSNQARLNNSAAAKKRHVDDPSIAKRQSESLKLYYESHGARQANRARQIASHSSAESRQRHSDAMKACLTANPDIRRKMSEAKKKMFESEEARQKNRDAQKKCKNTTESRTKHSVAMKKLYESEAALQKNRDAQKKVWDDPVYREIHLARMALGRLRAKLSKASLCLVVIS